MSSHKISRGSRFILIAEFVFVAYMLYALTTALYKSYQIDRHIDAFERENQKIAVENEQLSKDYAYYTSPQYQEKIAKQNFGLVQKGEEVIILPPSDVIALPESEILKTRSQKRWNILTNTQKWWIFFFEKDRFELE